MYILQYLNKEVVNLEEYDSNKNYNNNASKIIGSIEDVFNQSLEVGLNISIFWKTGKIKNIKPSEKKLEIEISDHPTLQNIKRKAFVHRLDINYSEQKFVFGTVVRHYNKDTGEHIKNQELDDEYYTSKADNKTVLFYNGDINSSLLQSKPVKEYDYYVNLINNSNNIFDMQIQGIQLLDLNKRFDEIY